MTNPELLWDWHINIGNIIFSTNKNLQTMASGTPKYLYTALPHAEKERLAALFNVPLEHLEYQLEELKKNQQREKLKIQFREISEISERAAQTEKINVIKNNS